MPVVGLATLMVLRLVQGLGLGLVRWLDDAFGTAALSQRDVPAGWR